MRRMFFYFVIILHTVMCCVNFIHALIVVRITLAVVVLNQSTVKTNVG